MSTSERYAISYGKSAIPVYRVYATPLSGLTPIPESPFTGRSNTLFAAEVDVAVVGNNFLPAYTHGDNTNVVATDSMKNFVLRQALAFTGSTLEQFLDLLGHGFLTTYPHMESLRLTGRELAFAPARVPDAAGAFEESAVLYGRSRDDYAVATLEYERSGDGARLRGHRCGRVGMQLFKVTGSSFTRFVRDDYTTLPERSDRPLFIYLDVFWTYADTVDMLAPDVSRYVSAEQVRDLVRVIFHEFVSESIQHLVHEMGQRLLSRFPQLASVSFAAQNRTRDPVVASETDPRVRVYSDPFSAYGVIELTMMRE